MAEEVGNYFIIRSTRATPYTSAPDLVKDIMLGKAFLIDAGTYTGSASELEFDESSISPLPYVKYVEIGGSDSLKVYSYDAAANSYSKASAVITIAGTSQLNACLKKVIKI